MEYTITVNDEQTCIEADADADVASTLRAAGYKGVKCGCDGGACGASTVIIDGEAQMACGLSMETVAGSEIETIGALGSQDDLHPIQQAFVDHLAVQCGFCIPGMIMQSKQLLEETPDPSEQEVREAIDNVVCRCTGYQKPVEAILDAAERLRDDANGEPLVTDGGTATPQPPDDTDTEEHPLEWDEAENNDLSPEERSSVSQPAEKADDRKLVTGQAKYTADYDERFPDLAHARVIRSEIPHGKVVEIDTSEANAMDGVFAVLTGNDEAVPDALYTSAGQSYPEPSPWDMRVLNEHVRYVGDPVAAVAAEDEATAKRAAAAIEVEYEEYDHVVDPEAAFSEDAPRLFETDEIDNEIVGHDYARNRMAHKIGRAHV